MPKVRRVDYWDSCVFLAFLNGEPERAETVQQVLVEIEETGEKRIATSALTALEVSHVAHEKLGILDASAEGAISTLLNRPSLVTVEANEAIINLARRLIRQALTRKYSLKPLDALHLATAVWLRENGIQVENFCTYDSLARYAELAGLQIGPPVVQQLRLDILTDESQKQPTD